MLGRAFGWMDNIGPTFHQLAVLRFRRRERGGVVLLSNASPHKGRAINVIGNGPQVAHHENFHDC